MHTTTCSCLCPCFLVVQFDVAVVATDPTALSATKTYTIYVQNSNDPPTFENKVLNIDVGLVAPNNDIDTLQATDVDGNVDIWLSVQPP